MHPTIVTLKLLNTFLTFLGDLVENDICYRKWNINIIASYYIHIFTYLLIALTWYMLWGGIWIVLVCVYLYYLSVFIAFSAFLLFLVLIYADWLILYFLEYFLRTVSFSVGPFARRVLLCFILTMCFKEETRTSTRNILNWASSTLHYIGLVMWGWAKTKILNASIFSSQTNQRKIKVVY